MPGRFTPAPQKALHAKAYTLQYNVTSGVLRGVRLNGITYPHDSAAVRLNDQNSVEFTDGGGIVPYTTGAIWAP